MADWADLLNIDFGGDPGLYDPGFDPGIYEPGFYDPGFSDPGFMWIDQTTGEPVTTAEAMRRDPSFDPGAGSRTGPFYGDPGAGSNMNMSPQQQSGIENALGLPAGALKAIPGLLSALAGAGLLTGAGAALFGGNQQNPSTGSINRGPTSSTTSTQPVQNTSFTNPTTNTQWTNPTQNSFGTAPVQNTTFTQPTFSQFYTNPTQSGFSTLPTWSSQSTTPNALSYPGVQGLLGQVMDNASAFARGEVPTLNSPQALEYFGNVLKGQNASVDYNSTNAVTDAMRAMQARGFAGGAEVFREGAPAAALGPILAQANAQKAMNMGNVNAQQLSYATLLPQLSSQTLMGLLSGMGSTTEGYQSGTGGSQWTSGTSGGQMQSGTGTFQNLGGTSGYQNLGGTSGGQNLGGTSGGQNFGGTQSTVLGAGNTTGLSQTAATPTFLQNLISSLPLFTGAAAAFNPFTGWSR